MGGGNYDRMDLWKMVRFEAGVEERSGCGDNGDDDDDETDNKQNNPPTDRSRGQK